jgi:hypothetical protein
MKNPVRTAAQQKFCLEQFGISILLDCGREIVDKELQLKKARPVQVGLRF